MCFSLFLFFFLFDPLEATMINETRFITQKCIMLSEANYGKSESIGAISWAICLQHSSDYLTYFDVQIISLDFAAIQLSDNDCICHVEFAILNANLKSFGIIRFRSHMFVSSVEGCGFMSRLWWINFGALNSRRIQMFFFSEPLWFSYRNL